MRVTSVINTKVLTFKILYIKQKTTMITVYFGQKNSEILNLTKIN